MRENGSAATCAANSAMRAIDCDQIATPELAVSGEFTCASELSRYRWGVTVKPRDIRYEAWTRRRYSHTRFRLETYGIIKNSREAVLKIA
jgi:hypothetical protein